MKTAAIAMILALSHGGQWLAGHHGTATLAWPVDHGLPPAVLAWDLRLGPTIVAHGTADVATADKPIAVEFAVPTVRATTHLRFTYHLSPRADPLTDLAAGDGAVRVYPDDLLGDFHERYAGQHVVVVGDAVADLLAEAKVKCERLREVTRVTGRPDLLLIGPGAVGPGPFDQPAAEAIAAAGGQVVFFRQDRSTVLAGYTVIQAAIRWIPF